MNRFQSSDGLSLAYADEGAGPAVLCLSGLTRNMADFDAIARRFATRARVIRMDYRGRGASDHAPDPGSYSIPREAQDALELLDHLGLDRAAILGTSRGGLIAMTLAVLAPDRLAGAILNDIGPVIDPRGIDAIMGYLGRPPVYASYDDAADRLPEAMAPAFANVPRETWRAHAARLWQETPGGLALRYDPKLRDAVAGASARGPAPDLWPLFQALATGRPLGLVRGANSDLLSAETAAEMRRRAPGMLYAEVPDRGHVPFLDEPAAVALIDTVLSQLS